MQHRPLGTIEATAVVLGRLAKGGGEADTEAFRAAARAEASLKRQAAANAAKAQVWHALCADQGRPSQHRIWVNPSPKPEALNPSMLRHAHAGHASHSERCFDGMASLTQAAGCSPARGLGFRV